MKRKMKKIRGNIAKHKLMGVRKCAEDLGRAWADKEMVGPTRAA